MPEQYNFLRDIGTDYTRDTWEEIGTISSDLPTGVDPNKKYTIETDHEMAMTGDNTVRHTLTKRYVPIKDTVSEPEMPSRESRSETMTSSFSSSWQQFDLETFHPPSAMSADNPVLADFLSGKIVYSPNGWVYPAGVCGVLAQPANVDSDMVRYKCAKEAGRSVRVLIPYVTVTITVTDTYAGELDGTSGIPNDLLTIVNDPDVYKPSIGAGAKVGHFGSTKVPLTIEYEYAGGSVSPSITQRNILAGGSIKTQCQYTISKSWSGVIAADTQSKLW